MKYFTKHLIYVLGVQRTGQHAISSWLIGHFNNVVYKNDILLKNSNKAHKGIAPPFWYFDLNKRPDFKWEESNEGVIRPNQDAIVLGSEFTDGNSKFNYNGDNLQEQKENMCKKLGVDALAEKETFICVIRSPWNQLASVLSWKPRYSLKNRNRFAIAWEMMAKECVGETNILPSNKKFVIYDKWFNDEDYRRSIASDLGLNFSDRGKNTVLRIGVKDHWGSSFDAMKHKQSASKMDVLNRWRNHIDDKPFKVTFKINPDLLRLSEKIFDDIPEEVKNI